MLLTKVRLLNYFPFPFQPNTWIYFRIGLFIIDPSEILIMMMKKTTKLEPIESYCSSRLFNVCAVREIEQIATQDDLLMLFEFRRKTNELMITRFILK